MFKEYLDKLSIASKEAVIDGSRNSFDSFKEYLHVNRYVQRKLEENVLSALESEKSQLILISGNVGDGKSHLMSRLYKSFPEAMEKIQVRNDATESNRTDRSWIDELSEFLLPFSDVYLESEQIKSTKIVAINLGILSSFLDQSEGFKKLTDFVRQKGIIDSLSLNNDFLPESSFQFINLADYSLFELGENESSSEIISSLLFKITDQNNDNPFYRSYLEFYADHPHREGCAMRRNYIELQKVSVQKGLIDLIMQAIISYKLIVSVRDVLNFIYDLIVPFEHHNKSGTAIKLLKNVNSVRPEDLLYNKLFESHGRSELLSTLSTLDPNKFRSKYLDNIIFKISSAEQPLNIFTEHNLFSDPTWPQATKNEVIIKTFMRSLFLNSMESFDEQNISFRLYSKYLYCYYANNKAGLRSLYKELIKAIYSWNGNSKKVDEINIALGQHQLKYNITQNILLQPSIKSRSIQNSDDKIYEFGNIIEIGMIIGKKEISFSLDINLYILLRNVIEGYSPNKVDRENHIDFQKAVDQITRMSSQGKAINFERLDGGNRKHFQLAYDAEFGYEFIKL